MSKIIKINENQLKNIVQELTKDEKSINEELNKEIHEEVNEDLRGIWDKMKEPFQKLKYGIKGMKSGTGIKFLPFVVMIRNILRQLKRIDEPNEKLMLKLENLKNRIKGMYLDQNLKDDLLYGIDNVQNSFRTYANAIDEMSVTLNQTLNYDPNAITKKRTGVSSPNTTTSNTTTGSTTSNTSSSSTNITPPPTTAVDYVRMVKARGYREPQDYNELLRLGMKRVDIGKALRGIPFNRP